MEREGSVEEARERIRASTLRDEAESVRENLAAAALTEADRQAIVAFFDELMGIELYDHLIVGRHGYTSLR